MKKSIELKQERLSLSDKAKIILEAAEKEKRSLTADEEKDYRTQMDRVDELSHAIVTAEEVEDRELENAARMFGAIPGKGKEALFRGSSSWSGTGKPIDDEVDVGEVLRPD